ncbi:hypothetical protein HK103_004989 [Boothiomyces macroporosus]|uniref:Non-haem dioxygenase N-terminal domain-containing protein n=1 Tax=Boothiomyces macroporosus TaxID=261099 RepID=A0AAD5UGF6_9FUNG|nr:hypothetical protein HK103_004989 [Boothiomyces macroporosus]
MVVVLDYNKLVDPDCDLYQYIDDAFGNKPGALGACFVSNVPGFPELREKCLRYGSQLAALSQSELDSMVDLESCYMFGWSHGKEIMNGKADFAKGSFYFNPLHDVPASEDPEFAAKFVEYGRPNIWPPSLPQMKHDLMELGQLIIKVGKLVALHCDKYISKKHPDLPPNFLQSMIEQSMIPKSRLLHYFPISKEDAEPTPDGSMDSWCGLHIDHSVLTGLTSAMYNDESDPSFPQVDTSNKDIQDALKDAGLYIKDKDEKFTQVKIPKEYLAFQIGEAAQVASKEALLATPHLVRGAAYPNMSRNTLALFMQPNVDQELMPGYTFHDFTKDIMARHYEQ